MGGRLASLDRLTIVDSNFNLDLISGDIRYLL